MSTPLGVKVAGYCPMGCGQTLEVTEALPSFIMCTARRCPRPGAANEILSDPETQHRVRLGEEDFSIIHPLSERLDDGLLDCRIGPWLASCDGPPFRPGLYRVCWYNDRREGMWEAL